MKGLVDYKMSKNDDRILELKEKIEKKKLELSDKNTRFVPVTNCIMELDGETNNLHTCDASKLALLLVKLSLYKKEAETLDIDFVVSGYSIDDWITDIKNKFEVTKTKAEMNSLKMMESKLDKLLSEDKKTELEIDDIAALLG